MEIYVKKIARKPKIDLYQSNISLFIQGIFYD